MPTRFRQTGAISQAEQIVRYLLQDPGTNDISTRIPSDTQLNSISINGGICYVNLSSHYLSTPEDLQYSGRVIAASLCTLPEVERVQILVDGAVPEDFYPGWFGPLQPSSDWFL